MTSADDSRAIGRLEGKMDRIIADQDRAIEARKQTYEKMDALGRKIDAVDQKVESIDARLGKVEGPVAEFSMWRERGVGALMLISFVAATFGGLVVAFGKRVWASIVGP